VVERGTRGESRSVYVIVMRILYGSDNLVDLDIDGEDNFRICLKEVVCTEVDWIYLSLGRAQWRSVTKTTFRYREKRVIYWMAER
jgi:hypothetical protein